MSNEQIASAKEWDLLSYLKAHEPHELVRCGINQYCTVSHDSLKISNGKWHWFSQGIGGKTALNYLIHVREMGFVDAVQHLNGKGLAPPPLPAVKKQTQIPDFQLPPVNQYNATVVSYLLQRGIDRRIIEASIERGLLYESKKYHNCVFVGYDKENIPRYANLRSTFAGFRGEVEGSDKRFSFKLAMQQQNKTLFATESPIDALSYATIAKQQSPGLWAATSYLSLGGNTPVALHQYMQDNPQTSLVLLGLDADAAGRKATAQITAEIAEKYGCRVQVELPRHGKDFNEHLLHKQKQQAKTNHPFDRER